jgi:hypothetical protein
MRAAVIAALLAAAAPAAGAPLALAERQVVSLEFQQAVTRVSTTDPDLLRVQVSGPRVSIVALRGGRASLEIAFADGATVSYEVSVEAARRPAAHAPRAAAPNELALRVGEERRFRAPGVARVLLEENGVARAAVEGEVVSVVGAAAGDASLVVVDGAGAKITWQIRVR